MIRKRVMGILGYLLFALVVAGVCLWYGFPYAAYVNTRLAELPSDTVRLSVKKAGPLLPCGLVVSGLDISCPMVAGMSGLGIDRMKMRLSPLSLYHRAWDTSLEAVVFGGSLEGKARFSPMRAPRMLVANGVLENIGLSGFATCLPGMENLTGTAQGKIIFSGQFDKWVQGEGNATLALRKVAAVVNYPLVPGFKIIDGEGDARVVLHKGEMEILSCDFTSKGINGVLSGKISLRMPYEKSSMNIKIMLSANEDIKDQPSGITMFLQAGSSYTVNVTGTFEKPRMKLLS